MCKQLKEIVTGRNKLKHEFKKKVQWKQEEKQEDRGRREERWGTEKMDQGGGHCLRCPGLCELKVSEKSYSSSVKGYPEKAAC